MKGLPFVSKWRLKGLGASPPVIKHISRWGNPKTLTPSPRTPTTDRVHGLLWTGPRTIPIDPLYGPPPQTGIKIIDEYFSYGLS